MDGLGRLIKVTEQSSNGTLDQETTYSYNLQDKLTGVNQGGQLRAFKYDSLGRLLYEKIPEQTATINDGTGTMWSSKYTYNEFSKVATKQDARGVITTYTYDGLNRVSGISYNTSGTSAASTPSVTYTYTGWGAISSVTIASEYTENYTFDDYNRPISVTRWILGQTSDSRKTYTTSYEYNGGSQIGKITYPSGLQVAVNHDDKGRLQSLTTNPLDTSGYLTAATYNLEARMTGNTLGNGVVQTYTFDTNRSQLVGQTAAQGGTQLLNLTYSYDAAVGQSGANTTAGNTHRLVSLTGTISSTTESASYTYDNLKRLATSTQTTNGSSAQRKFAYDRLGNRTTVWPSVFGGTAIQTVTLAQSGGAPTNQIASVTNSGVTVNYLYYAAGNMINDGAHSYTYDAENRVVSIDNGTTAQYKYDNHNQRVSKIVGANWTHYVWEGGQVIGEHDGTTPYTASPSYETQSARLDYIYARGKMIYARARSSSTGPWTSKYYLNDVWSTRLVLDSSGNVLGRQGHLPFGEEFGESGTQEKHHFTSYEAETESASDYAVNRQYSQSIGRFGSADPYQASSYLLNPQSWNHYSYVENDPIHNVDRPGLFLGYPGPDPDPCRPSCTSSEEPTPIKEKPISCDVVVPSNPNVRAAVAVLMGEATSEFRIGQPQYQDGDRPGAPSGETIITRDILYAEMVEMVDVIVNRARRGMGGDTWAEVASSGAFLGYDAGKAMLDSNLSTSLVVLFAKGFAER